MSDDAPPDPGPQQPAPESPGRLGGAPVRAGQTRDPRLYEQALRERWPVPPAARARVVKRLLEVVNNKASSPRELTSAAKALCSMSSINLSAIGTASNIKSQEE